MVSSGSSTVLRRLILPASHAAVLPCRDGRMYLAGAEDGHIYKCSTSYSEQYLEAYNGHIGPVYQVQWSPFRSDLFISCSADWSIKLWAEGKVSASSTLCCTCPGGQCARPMIAVPSPVLFVLISGPAM